MTVESTFNRLVGRFNYRLTGSEGERTLIASAILIALREAYTPEIPVLMLDGMLDNLNDEPREELVSFLNAYAGEKDVAVIATALMTDAQLQPSSKGEERLSTVGSILNLMTAENEFAAFLAQWNTSIRGNPTPSPDAWDYFRRWSVWNSNSFHHSALDTIRTSFLLLAVELNNRVTDVDDLGLGGVDETRFRSTRVVNLADSRYASFEEGYSFSENCTTCVNRIALTPSGLSACTLFEDLVHGIGSPMQSRCSAYQKSIPAAVPFPKGIEVNRWFQQHIDTRDLAFLARVLYEMSP